MSDSILINGSTDNHGTLIVESSNLADLSNDDFSNRLKQSLQEWSKSGRKGIMFRIGAEQSQFISVLAKNGFTIHHGRGTMVTMTKWLPQNIPDSIPPYAHTMVGAGAVVVTQDSKILAVHEKYRSISYWKLPGGYVEPGEDIVDAAQREVFEETNIKTEFVSLVAVRHTKTSAFNCSDLYFIVELRPITFNIIVSEVEDAQWMPLDEYLQHEQVHENNKFFIRQYLESKAGPLTITRIQRTHPITKSPQVLYHMTPKSA